MMQRRDAFPAEAGEERDAMVFLILREGLKISHDEISEGEKRQWDAECEEAVRFIRLKRERDGRDHVGKMDGEEKFSRPAVDEAEGRDGVCKDDSEGEEKKEERRKRQGIVDEEDVCGESDYNDTG